MCMAGKERLGEEANSGEVVQMTWKMVQGFSCVRDMLQLPKFSVGDVSKFRAAPKNQQESYKKWETQKKIIRWKNRLVLDLFQHTTSKSVVDNAED